MLPSLLERNYSLMRHELPAREASMDRRSFCQIIAAAGVAQAALPSLAAESKPPKVAPQSSVTELQKLENDFLSVTIFSDASAHIVDRQSKAEWRMGRVALQEESPIDIGHVWLRVERSICEQYPGRFVGTRVGNRIRFTVIDPLRNDHGSFFVEAALDGRWLSFKLTDIDSRLPSLVFPPPIESTSLVLPIGIGKWIRRPLSTRQFLPFFSRLNMRWFGGIRGDNCWMALLPEQNFVDGGAMATEMSVSPAWLTSLGQWTPRTVRYTFASGGYVQLARIYRQWAIENGLHRSLKDKIRQTPALANLSQGRMVSLMVADAKHPASYQEDVLESTENDPLCGPGVRVNFTHAQSQKITSSLSSAGLSHALVNVRGWINGGYDYSHPDPFPTEPALGPTAELQSLCRTADPITVALHDNYQDMYDHVPSWPKGVVRTRSGAPMAGGYWGGGQAYIINARDSVRYAKRNWEQIRQLGPRAIFIDTTSAVQMYESYEPGNRLTRTQDMLYKQELIQFFKSKGLAFGSEEGADFAVPYADWFENRHARIPGETVPLWPLVFHDAIMCGRYSEPEGWPFDWSGDAHSDTYPQWLLDMLWGYFLISSMQNPEHWPQFARRVRANLHVDEWFRQISTADMLDHKFLTPDQSLEMTRFSTGDALIANFAPEQLTHDGITVPGYGYKIIRV